jgi:hypothetical protein
MVRMMLFAGNRVKQVFSASQFAPQAAKQIRHGFSLRKVAVWHRRARACCRVSPPNLFISSRAFADSVYSSGRNAVAHRLLAESDVQTLAEPAGEGCDFGDGST